MKENNEVRAGDKVIIIGCPVTGNRLVDQYYNEASGLVGVVRHIYKYGERNTLVEFGKYHAVNYYQKSDLSAPTTRLRVNI